MNTAILYSSYFCIAIQLPSALGDVYHWSSSEVGAGYVVVGVAMVIGSICGCLLYTSDAADEMD